MNIKYSAVSHCGKLRKENQDRIFLSGTDDSDRCLREEIGSLQTTAFSAAVFDGMGGELCGGAAAEIAVRTAQKKENMPLILLCREINQNICRYMEQYHISSMGTTAVIVRIRDNAACCCNLGDSRAYHFSRGKMQRISVDHTTNFGKKRVLTQYLGIPETEIVIEPSVRKITLEKNEKLLLCSDGLTDMVSEDEIAGLLNAHKTEDAAKELFRAAMENGGKDNISIIVFEVV